MATNCYSFTVICSFCSTDWYCYPYFVVFLPPIPPGGRPGDYAHVTIPIRYLFVTTAPLTRPLRLPVMTVRRGRWTPITHCSYSVLFRYSWRPRLPDLLLTYPVTYDCHSFVDGRCLRSLLLSPTIGVDDSPPNWC